MAGNASMTIFIGGDNSDFLKKWESTKRALRKGLGSEAMAASESIATGLAAATAALAAFGVASIKLAGDMDASRKALAWLSSGGVTSTSTHGYAKDALKWAAFTYVIAALSSLATLLYYIMVYMNRRN